MSSRHSVRWTIFCLTLMFLSAQLTAANAVPSYAEQTGQSCNACHIGGFGPRLTPFGRAFKLGGYTNRVADSLPLSAMAVAPYLHTTKDQDAPPAPHYATNDNVTLDEASLFLAGGIGDHFGGFIQGTYDGVGRSFSRDNLDLRAVTNITIANSNALAGLDVNNNPTIEDAWNTLPAWSFPFTDSALAPGPDAAPLISDALAQNVVGISAYALWDSSIYTEIGIYQSLGQRFLSAMGVDPSDTNLIHGVAPYFRIAYQRDFGNQNFELGGFGLLSDVYPGRDRSAHATDSYRDFGLDGSYQFVGSGDNIYTVNATYVRESRDLTASTLLGGAASTSSTLEDFRIRGSYYWHNMIGGTVGAFETWGPRDPLLYADNRTQKPDSSGFIFQVDATPFGDGMSALGARFNLRVGMQYTLFTRFNGAAHDYDGSGRRASDNNTFRFFLWTVI